MCDWGLFKILQDKQYLLPPGDRIATILNLVQNLILIGETFKTSYYFSTEQIQRYQPELFIQALSKKTRPQSSAQHTSLIQCYSFLPFKSLPPLQTGSIMTALKPKCTLTSSLVTTSCILFLLYFF